MRDMKDSGVKWIGEIPANWELSKIGAVYEERNSKVSDSEYPPLSVTKKGIVPQLETAAKTDNGDNRKLIMKNDFVINSRSDRRGSCGISEYDGSCSLINTVLKPRKNMENDYASQAKWQSYARNNDRKTFMLLFEKDFPNMAAQRYEQNDDFFVRMFSDPELMRQVMETVGSVLYERLRKTKTIRYDFAAPISMVAEEPAKYGTSMKEGD